MSETTAAAPTGRRLFVLSFTALGIVYGDIGTSPLYALRECFGGPHGLPVSPGNVLGILSLILWSLILVVSLKYLVFILRADNHGEGGILALMSLVAPTRGTLSRRLVVLQTMGLFGAALLYGDSMITPAISVLSAVEGLEIAAPGVAHFVLPLTVAILVALFLAQRHGTAKVGAVFGPVTLVWFLVLAVLGLAQILRQPGVLAAADPLWAARFFAGNGLAGFIVLGSVFLVVTGGEALYADMGHFGPRPIRLVWFAVVLPSLIVNYFGQGALLLSDPATVANPFYLLAPRWALVPLLVLATAATIIASQAVISGAFSLTMQAVHLGFSPRLAIDHTSGEQKGQVYIKSVNWLLMLASIALVLGFGSSSNLASAYGVAVTSTMVITSVLFFDYLRDVRGWKLAAAGGLCLTFLVVDLAFFGANLAKILHGGWFPLGVAAVVLMFMRSWNMGRQMLARRLAGSAMSLAQFVNQLPDLPVLRLPGTAVYMSGNPRIAPRALIESFKHYKALHEKILSVTVVTEDMPSVPEPDRMELLPLGHGIFQVTLHFGFMERPEVPAVLSTLTIDGEPVDLFEATFFLGRETMLLSDQPGMSGWRKRLFNLMSVNARSAMSFFGLPPDRVVEIGSVIEL